MRREPTEAERRLWGALRNSRLGGYKFYRQVPIGPFIVDFLNQEFGLVVEVDGATHSTVDEIVYDVKRTAFLNAKGLRIHRVDNLEIIQNMSSVCDGILAALIECGA